MADDLNKILMEETEKLVDEFRKDLINILINDRQLKSDSKTLNSLRVSVSQSSKYVALMGVDYIYYVIHGRGPGRFPPPNPLTGIFEIPFPVAKEIAMFGNKEKYAHVAKAFDDLYKDLIKKVTKKAGEVSLAYVLRLGTLRDIG